MYFPQLGLPLGQRGERKTGILLSFFGPQGPLNPAPLDKKTDLFCVLGICVADAATATADIYSWALDFVWGQGKEKKIKGFSQFSISHKGIFPGPLIRKRGFLLELFMSSSTTQF